MSTEHEQLAENRRLHYVMSYHVIPEKLFTEGQILMERLKSVMANEYLKDLWRNTYVDERLSFMGSGELKVEVLSLKEKEVICIAFPKPERVPESHFAAILKQDDHYRYFTLEVFYNFKELTQVLGEITISGQHRTYGIEVPEATKEDFLKAIENRLELEGRKSTN